MYAHDDLVQAIAMSENQFAAFIDEYQKQLQVHAQLTDTNRQLAQLHTVADKKFESQQNSSQALSEILAIFSIKYNWRI